MKDQLLAALNWLLGPETRNPASPGQIVELGVGTWREGATPKPAVAEGKPTHLWPRWIFLRALGLIYFSAFYSFYFQVKGLIGPDGILPAGDYLRAIAASPNIRAVKYLVRADASMVQLERPRADADLLDRIDRVGASGDQLLAARGPLCLLRLFSFVYCAAQDFSSYQSDGMLLEAGFISLFFAPPGLWPGLAASDGPSRRACSCCNGNGSASTSNPVR